RCIPEREQVMLELLDLGGAQAKAEVLVVVGNVVFQGCKSTVVVKAALGVGPEALQRRRSIAAIRRALRLERIDADFLRRVHVVAGLRKDRRDVAGRALRLTGE